MALGGSGDYVANVTILEFRTYAYDESCDLRSGDAFDITAPSFVDYDGSFWQTIAGLTACLMCTQAAALGFSIALAPKFPIPNRSVWGEDEANKLGVNDLTLEDWDLCRQEIFRAMDLFQPGELLNSATLDKYIYDDRISDNNDWQEAWHTQTGRYLDDNSLKSMRKVFRYMKLAVKARQKLLLNVELAHALFMLQLFSAVAQSLQHAYRSNRLFWHQVDMYGLSDAILLAAYPTRLFTTIMLYSRLVVSASAVNNFFREVSLRARDFTAFACQWIVVFYLGTTPADFAAVLLYFVCHASFDRIYLLCCMPKKRWKGICFTIVCGSTLVLIPLLVHSLAKWLFASSAMDNTTRLRLCDMERVLLWDVDGHSVSDFAVHIFSSLDQNMAGLLAVCLLGAIFLSLVARYRGHGVGGWKAALGIRPGTMLKVWVLQPEYYASGFHFDEKDETVASILGTTWWWHTVGLFNPKYEKYYQHAEKTFYARRRLLRLYGMSFVHAKQLGKKQTRILRQVGLLTLSLRYFREARLRCGSVLCPTCRSSLAHECLPSASFLLQQIKCHLCDEPLLRLTGLAGINTLFESYAYFCSSRACKEKFIFCQRCHYQVATGDACWTYEALRAWETLTDKTPEVDMFPELAIHDLSPGICMPPLQASENLAEFTGNVPNHLSNLDTPKSGLLQESAIGLGQKPKSPKKLKQKRRRRLNKDQPAASDLSP